MEGRNGQIESDSHQQTHAESIQATLAKSKLGYAKIPISALSPEFQVNNGVEKVELTFGHHNPRPAEPQHIAKLRQSFRAQGVWQARHPMTIMVDKNKIDPTTLRNNPEGDLPYLLPPADMRKPVPNNVPASIIMSLKCLGGRHRYLAAKQELEAQLKDISLMEDILVQIRNGKTMDMVTENNLESQLTKAKARVESYKYWVVEVHDEGASSFHVNHSGMIHLRR